MKTIYRIMFAVNIVGMVYSAFLVSLTLLSMIDCNIMTVISFLVSCYVHVILQEKMK